MKQLRRLLVKTILFFQRQRLKRRLGRVVLEQVDEVPLIALPQVFHPVVFRTSVFFVRTFPQVPRLASGARVLDMGTGSGIGAIFAARLGCQVVGVDINPEAVRCARINVLLNCLEERVEIRESDLFTAVEGERFDCILFNPPFFRGTPKNALDRAWRSDDVPERFAEALPRFLTPNGMALLVLSSHGSPDVLLDALTAQGLFPHPIRQHDYGTEILTIYAVSQTPEWNPR